MTVPDRGISEALARERKARVFDLRYRLSFAFPRESTAGIAGTAEISFSLVDADGPLAFDFDPRDTRALTSVCANGASVAVSVEHGHVVLPRSDLREGTNRIVFEFEAGDAPLNRQDEFLYTLFVPARAHETFPCFDQPDLKARWTLALEIPSDWEAVSNAPETARTSSLGQTQLTFAETAPLPTYLFAFAAGRLHVESAQRDGRTFRVFHRETDHSKIARNLDPIVDLHAASLAWLEDYTNIPYPFEKFDILQVPAFQFGGMEHPGVIYYNASSQLLDRTATQNQELDRANTIAHETAHMWFGDLVTMRWFDDVWLKEVFAGFMAAKIVNPSFPGVDHELRFLLAHYPGSYDVDRTEGTNAIRQPLDNLKNAGMMYGAIIYLKAPIVMRQLEARMGAPAFRDGVRDYLRRFAFDNASWPELIALLSERTHEDLASWSHAWVDEPGRPTIRTDLVCDGGQVGQLAFTATDPIVERQLTWAQDIEVALGYADRVELQRLRLNHTRSLAHEVVGRTAPLFVLPNGGGIAYGDFRLDSNSLSWLSVHLPEIRDALTRGSAWVTLWDAVLNGDLPVPAFVDLALAASLREPDELIVQRVLSSLTYSVWKLLDDRDRQSRAHAIEHALRAGLAAAGTPSLKSAYFASIRDLARTTETVTWLRAVWRGDDSPGFALAEADFVVLAQELAVRDTQGWDDLLREQLERTTNLDRRARLAFVVPALSSEADDRDRFFASLADASNRRHEPWVLDGLRILNHPLRASVAEHYLQPGLELLEEIQRTGDIFFPKRWVEALLSGHRSSSAAHIVRAFLANRPATYSQRLRAIILSSADGVFRASALSSPVARHNH